MRVLLVKKSLLGFGGGAELFLECAEAYKRRGFLVEISVLEMSNHSHFVKRFCELSIDSLIDQRVLGNTLFSLVQKVGWILFIPLSFVQAQRCSGSFDIIHIHESFGPWYAWLLRTKLSQDSSLKFVGWTLNDLSITSPYSSRTKRLFYRLLGPIFRNAEIFFSRWLSSVFVLDERTLEQVRQYFKSSDVKVSLNRVAVVWPSIKSGTKAGRISSLRTIVLCNSSFSSHRRFEDVIRAVSLLNSRAKKNIKLVIVGDGSRSRLPAYLSVLAGELSVDCQIIPSRISDHELQNYYCEASVFCFVGERQAWGLAPLKALALGVPSVVSRGCGVSEVLDGICDLVDVGDIEAIARCIDQPTAIDLVRVRTLLSEISTDRYIEALTQEHK